MSSKTLDLQQELDELRKNFSDKMYPSAADRKRNLTTLKNIILENQQSLVDALSQDYGYRSEFDSLISDILPTISYIKYNLKHMSKWMKKGKRHAGLLLAPSKLEVHYQPLGVVGVVVPWNFPINLSLAPAVAALGAGNMVMVKLSEFTPNVNKVLIEILKPLQKSLRFYEGAVEVSTEFTNLAFDHLLFTGSTKVGRIVAQAAAKNLTPVTLELGGKSPTIVTESANLSQAVDSILLGKTLNSGQICVSPDYIFIHHSLEERFIALFQKKVSELYDGQNNNKLTHIINKDHFDRLNDYIADAKEKGADVIKTKEPEDSHSTQLYPTLISKVSEDMKLMQEEIFGSLLPIKTYHSLSEVFEYIAKRPRPLALYVMSSDKQEIDEVIYNTHSGGVCVNDTIIHVAADDAPFGGIGHSGMGHYHGREGFLTFSKAKTVVKSKSYIPKNWFLLKNRDLTQRIFRWLFL